MFQSVEAAIRIGDFSYRNVALYRLRNLFYHHAPWQGTLFRLPPSCERLLRPVTVVRCAMHCDGVNNRAGHDLIFFQILFRVTPIPKAFSVGVN